MLGLALVPAAATAQAGYAGAPYREAPVTIAHAAALERIDVAARAFAARPPGAVIDEGEPETEGDEAEGPPADFTLFRASLAAADPEVERRLAAAIAEMAEAAERGASAAGPSAEVIALTHEARGVLLPNGVEAPEFRAALTAALLIDEGGVAEGYEGAVEGEDGSYEIGWFALDRVKALWTGLAAQATPEQAQDVEMHLDTLDELFPTIALPERMSPDPEQAETPAQMLVGLLEEVADADLYPGRDLGTATRLVRTLAAQGCETIETGDQALAAEELTIAAAYYRQTLEDTLRVMSPDVGAAIASQLDTLKAGEAGAAACGPLMEALAAGGRTVTP